MAGILQVFTFLIVPALIGNYLPRTLKVLIGGWLPVFFSVSFGLFASYKWICPQRR